MSENRLLIIACGALAKDILTLKALHNWQHVDLTCIDASLHHRPALIPDRLDAAITKAKDSYDQIFVGYADCGTVGGIDAVCDRHGVDRLTGSDCFANIGGKTLSDIMVEEPGTFFLTDFLVRYFEQFVIKPFKLDTNPEMRDAYFGNYQQVVYLSQQPTDELCRQAESAAAQLGLSYTHQQVGYGALEQELIAKAS